MSWIAVAAVGGAAVSGIMSNRAAGIQSRSGERAIDLSRDIYNTSRSDLGPYREAGLAALTRLRTLMGIGPEGAGAPGSETGSLSRRFTSADLTGDPVYQSGLNFGLTEGEKAINARAIAGGSYDSGATLKALTRYATDYGSTKGAESYNRFVTDQGNQYSRLAGIAGSGQNAANMSGNLGAHYAGAAGNIITGVGNVNAAATLAGGRATSGAISDATNYYNQNRMLQQLSPGGERSSDVNYIERGA